MPSLPTPLPEHALIRLRQRRTNERTHKHTGVAHTQVLTFPGGDESGQELAEVGAGVGVVQRKGFQLGGRASVLVVGLLHRVDVRLQKSCPAGERIDVSGGEDGGRGGGE